MLLDILVAWLCVMGSLSKILHALVVVEWLSSVHDVSVLFGSLVLSPLTDFARDSLVILTPVVLVNIDVVLLVIPYFRPFVSCIS